MTEQKLRIVATEESVAAAAAQLLENGETPTLTRVRDALGGGSFSTISPLLRKWQTTRAQQDSPKLTVAVPETVDAALQTLGTSVWSLALDAASERLAKERDALALAREQLELERDDAIRAADTTAEECERLEKELADERAERTKDQAQLEQLKESHNELGIEKAKLEERVNAHAEQALRKEEEHKRNVLELKDAHAAREDDYDMKAAECANELTAAYTERNMLETFNQQLQNAIAEQQTKIRELEKDAKDADRESNDLSQDNAALRERIESLNSAHSELKKEMKQMQSTLDQTRENAAKAVGAYEHINKECQALKQANKDAQQRKHKQK